MDIVEISGMSSDTICKSLYVLSAVSRFILHSSLNGQLIGNPLNVSAVGDPGGLSYKPMTGDLIVFGDSCEVARYSKRIALTTASTKLLTNVPIVTLAVYSV